jgi:hypothetical protein
MSKLVFEKRRSIAPLYAALAPEGIYRISLSANRKWKVRTPFGEKHVDSLSEAKRVAERIRFNTLRETPKSHR